MSEIELTGEVVCPMGPTTRALKLDISREAERFREWCERVPIASKIATVSSITGPDDGGVPLVYFGAGALVARCKAGDRATIRVQDRKWKDGRGILTTDLRIC